MGFHHNFLFSFHYSLSYQLGHLLVCKSKNFGSWVYQLMIQFIVVSSFFLQDYISFIFSLVFFFVVFIFGVVVFLFLLQLYVSCILGSLQKCWCQEKFSHKLGINWFTTA